jgi:hypothetical protein
MKIAFIEFWKGGTKEKEMIMDGWKQRLEEIRKRQIGNV